MSPRDSMIVLRVQECCMYHDYSVAVPEVPGKIVFMKRGGCVYVYVELDRVYYADKGYNSAQRTLIGKLVDASDRTKMYPNLNYDKLFGAEPAAPQQGQPEPSVSAQPLCPALIKSKSKLKAQAKSKAQVKTKPQPKPQMVAAPTETSEQDLVKLELWVPREFVEGMTIFMNSCRSVQGMKLEDLVVTVMIEYALKVFSAEMSECLHALGNDPAEGKEIVAKLLQDRIAELKKAQHLSKQ